MPPTSESNRVLECLARAGGHAHLLGAGGVGMAGLARLLAARGVRVSGCDLAQNRMTAWLAGHGVRVEQGHDPAHVAGGVTWVIRSTAVPEDSPEVRSAVARGLPVFQRGAVLAALLEGRRSIAVSGTHGKTTTSSMITQVLAACGRDPGFCIGGETDRLGGVASPGGGEILVVEADESDGTISRYHPDITVVTNIEYDHMEHFSGREEVEQCFARLVEQTRECVVYCADDEAARRVCGGARHAVSYGFTRGADWVGRVVAEDAHSVTLSLAHGNAERGVIAVGVPGRHNALNAMAACVVGRAFGCGPAVIGSALREFEPVRRRFELVAEKEGLRVISDYAHHPSEIRAVVDMARALGGARLVAVFQPHRYTRTRALGKEFPPAFDGIEKVYLTPVYAASERPVEGGTAEDLCESFKRHRPDGVTYCQSLRSAWNQIRSDLHRGDLLLVLGAGDVELIAEWAKDEMTTGALAVKE
ncbi:MAG: UDP-N-acetylmuramate--L-alanine ligase [Kiritimatiellae bacterium]|nr:UDP-N-acetylmuramate--L-alanine ligase [Kiritimatiellia bacterium]